MIPSAGHAIPEILRIHAEEFGFLWAMRERVVFAPDWDLRKLAALEARAEAHLVGLRIGGSSSVDTARPDLGGDKAGAAMVAAFIFMAMDAPALEEELLSALATAGPEAREGIRIGLHHSDVTRIQNGLGRLAETGDPGLVATVLEILAFHRLPPPVKIAALLGTPYSKVWRLLVDAVGRFGGPWSIDYLQGALDQDGPSLRWAALWTSARLGTFFMDSTCRKAATRSEDPVPEALAFLGVLGNPNDLSLFESALDRPRLAMAAVSAMGSMGRIAAIPALIEVMKDARLCHAAGRAFVRITGSQDIDWGPPITPPDDLADEERDHWDGGRSPDPDRARDWWMKEKSRFSAEGRWQAGVEVQRDPLGETFNTLPLEIRRDIYMCERARNPEKTSDLELEQRASLQLGIR